MSLEQRVKEALSRCAPWLRIKQLRFIKEGWENYVFELNRRYILKIPRSKTAFEKLKKEACVLQSLCFLEVPKKVCETKGVLVYRKIQGVTASQASKKELAKLAPEFTDLLSRVHSVKPPSCVAIYDKEAWKKRVMREYTRLLLSSKRVVQTELVLKAKKLVYTTELSFTPKFIHGDIDERNIILRKNRIVGIIDWGEAMVGDIALDYAGLFFSKTLGARVLKLQKEEKFSKIVPRVRFYYTLVPLYWISYGIKRSDTSLTKKGVVELQKRLQKV